MNDNTEPIEILLVEDNPGDARLAVEALKDSKIRNNLYHVKDRISFYST
jgi:chemotaxis family two-component system response regulator Rcp1